MGGSINLRFETNEQLEGMLLRRIAGRGGYIEATAEFWERFERKLAERRRAKAITAL